MDLFQHEWYGRYWLTLLLHNRMFWFTLAAVVLLVFWLTRITRRR
ncbi:MAG TPA: hypothetical protein VI298_18110 [Geobacteraceae bacterium]